MADPTCIHCAGTGLVIEHQRLDGHCDHTHDTELACDCDGACQDCAGRGVIPDDDDTPLTCGTCLGSKRATGFVDIDWWLTHDGGHDITGWDEPLGDAMHWTPNE